jgi:hypothetical protein
MRSAGGLVAAALIGAACYGPTGPRIVQSGSPAEVVLAVGDEARIDAVLRVAFTGVPADSRCPATAECVWAGDAVVVLAVALGMGPSYPDTVHTTLDPKAVQFAGYTITLLALMPYPQIPGPIPADEYAARLRIERSSLLSAPS